MLLPLVTAPYLSRAVGTEGVGLYSLAWSVSYVFCLIGMLGLADYGVRTIAQARDNREELDRDKVRLREMYWKKGYLDFRVLELQLTEDPGNPEIMHVVFVIEEGEPYKVN